MGRVERRKVDLHMAAVAFYERKASLDELCHAALRYATAVFHNRRSNLKRQRENSWLPKTQKD